MSDRNRLHSFFIFFHKCWLGKRNTVRPIWLIFLFFYSLNYRKWKFSIQFLPAFPNWRSSLARISFVFFLVFTRLLLSIDDIWRMSKRNEWVNEKGNEWLFDCLIIERKENCIESWNIVIGIKDGVLMYSSPVLYESNYSRRWFSDFEKMGKNTWSINHHLVFWVKLENLRLIGLCCW